MPGLLLICVSLNCLRHQANETSYSLLIRISAAVCAAAACRLAAAAEAAARAESEFEIWLMSKLQLFTAAGRWPPPATTNTGPGTWCRGREAGDKRSSQLNTIELQIQISSTEHLRNACNPLHTGAWAGGQSTSPGQCRGGHNSVPRCAL